MLESFPKHGVPQSSASRSAAAEAQQARQLMSQLVANGSSGATQAHANHATQEAGQQAPNYVSACQHNLQQQ